MANHIPINIHSAVMERVTNIKFLGVHLADDVTFFINNTAVTRKAQRPLSTPSGGSKRQVFPLLTSTSSTSKAFFHTASLPGLGAAGPMNNSSSTG